MIFIPRFIFQSERHTAVARQSTSEEVESCEAGVRALEVSAAYRASESIHLYLFRTLIHEIAQYKGSTKPLPSDTVATGNHCFWPRGKGMTGEGFAAVLPCRQGRSKDAMKYTECGQPAFTPMLGYCGWHAVLLLA
jgi:hypothetical protein